MRTQKQMSPKAVNYNAEHIISYVDAKLESYPQIERLLLESVSIACGRLSDFLIDVQAQVEKRTNEIKKATH